jgi:hypothetical protein
MEIQELFDQFKPEALAESWKRWESYKETFPTDAKKRIEQLQARFQPFDVKQWNEGSTYCDTCRDITCNGVFEATEMVPKIFAQAKHDVRWIMMAYEVTERFAPTDQDSRAWLLMRILPHCDVEDLNQSKLLTYYGRSEFKYNLTATTMAELREQMIEQAAAALSPETAIKIRPFMETVFADYFRNVLKVPLKTPKMETRVVKTLIRVITYESFTPDFLELGWTAKDAADKWEMEERLLDVLSPLRPSRDASPVRKPKINTVSV